jgi:hypothetical protein
MVAECAFGLRVLLMMLAAADYFTQAALQLLMHGNPREIAIRAAAAYRRTV